jgi:hypothetical protein
VAVKSRLAEEKAALDHLIDPWPKDLTLILERTLT